MGLVSEPRRFPTACRIALRQIPFDSAGSRLIAAMVRRSSAARAEPHGIEYFVGRLGMSKSVAGNLKMVGAAVAIPQGSEQVGTAPRRPTARSYHASIEAIHILQKIDIAN